MRSPRVVERQIAGQPVPGGGHAFIGAQVDLLVFDATPEPLDEDVVAPGPLAIHADLEAGVLQCLDEVYRRELAAVVGVHDLRRAVSGHGLVQHLQAGPGFQRDRQSTG